MSWMALWRAESEMNCLSDCAPTSADNAMEELPEETRRQIHQSLDERNYFVDSEKVGWYERKTLASSVQRPYARLGEAPGADPDGCTGRHALSASCRQRHGSKYWPFSTARGCSETAPSACDWSRAARWPSCQTRSLRRQHSTWADNGWLRFRNQRPPTLADEDREICLGLPPRAGLFRRRVQGRTVRLSATGRVRCGYS